MLACCRTTAFATEIPNVSADMMNDVDTERIKLSAESAAGASFEELAASQGVQPIVDFEALLGHSSNVDESVEEFGAMLREWRSEGVPAKREA